MPAKSKSVSASASASAAFAVETRDVRKQYPGVEALAGLSLAVAPGEIFALLGPNGAGKTTWISLVCGLVRATSGHATVFGHDVVRDAVAARKLVGLVPQEVGFDPFFTPREALRFQMGYFGLRPDDRRVDEVLGAMGLSAKADTNTRALSGGMKRRLLIAKALVHFPRVLFLDEPTAGVDVALRRDLWEYVRALRAQGTTIVLTTHYLEEVEALADRVAVIDNGRLIRLDTPRRLLAGHGRRRLRVTFASSLHAAPGLLSDGLRAAGAELDPTGSVVTCPIDARDLSPVLAALAAVPVAVVEIETEQPSLEQVFLELTGKKLS
jgi:ABC-2 type transport system ATP-binding protein